MTYADRESIEVDALRTDRYLDALLAARDRGATDAPTDTALDPAVRAAGLVLGRDLARVHPSFRFEERLADRLAGIAASMRLPAVAGGEGTGVPVVTLPRRAGTHAHPDVNFGVLDSAGGRWAEGPRRPLIIGGAMASAALSIAGAAFVAWLRSRPPATPMSRAVRAARHTRVGRLAAFPAARRARLD